MTELQNIQQSLSSGEKEKAELMASLSRLRDDLTRLKPLNNDMSPDLSTLSLPQEKFSTASQTDLSGTERFFTNNSTVLIMEFNLKQVNQPPLEPAWQKWRERDCSMTRLESSCSTCSTKWLNWKTE